VIDEDLGVLTQLAKPGEVLGVGVAFEAADEREDVLDRIDEAGAAAGRP